MDVLELFLDDDDEVEVQVTAKSSDKVPPLLDDGALDLLMEEFRSAPDAAAQKDALLAMLQLTGRSK